MGFFAQEGCNLRLDYNLVAGLNALGYELKLVKKGSFEVNNEESHSI